MAGRLSRLKLFQFNDHKRTKRNEVNGCGKVIFTSIDAIKKNYRSSSKGYRIRTYWCSECLGYHVTNSDKQSNWDKGRTRRK